MTTKAAYLEHYLDSLETLPAELQRNFNLMRDLDTRAHDEMKTIDRLTAEYLQSILEFTSDEKYDNISQIRKFFKKALDYGDDKVQLAMQTYEMVDKHIRRLDADLARFEADLKDKTLNPNASEVETAHKSSLSMISGVPSARLLPSPSSNKDSTQEKGRKAGEKEKKKGRRVASDDDEIPKSVRKKIKTQAVIQPEIGALPATLTITHPSDVLDMPVDPNEPTYCFCHQVSYGEMIGCDNPDCPIEWFHFACVGLTCKPKGKWYCSNCSAERKKK